MTNGTNGIYSLLLLFAGSLSLVTMRVAWKRRQLVPYAAPLAAFCLGTALWSLPYAVHWTGLLRISEFFWLDLTYLGAATVPTAFFAFALSYTDRGHWLSKRIILGLAIVPMLTLLFLWTDPLFGLFFAGKRLAGDAVIMDGGIWFWMQIVYSYALIIMGLLFLMVAFVRFSRTYRRQVGIILLGCLIPVVFGTILLLDIGPIPNLDLTPISFTLTGLLISIGVFRFGFLDLMPVAYEILFASLTDAVIVLDQKNRILELNPRAKSLIGDFLSAPIGHTMDELQIHMPALPSNLSKVQDGQAEFSIDGHPPRHFEMTISPLLDRSDVLCGRLLTIRDITENKEAKKRLEHLARHDSLTGLYNRHAFDELIEQEVRRSTRYVHPIGILLIDVNRFKEVNDRFGHAMGDAVLKSVAEILETSVRDSDLVVRFGGDEFLLVLIETGETDVVVSRIREQIAERNRTNRLVDFPVTLAIGAGYWNPDASETIDSVLAQIDMRMYENKAAQASES